MDKPSLVKLPREIVESLKFFLEDCQFTHYALLRTLIHGNTDYHKHGERLKDYAFENDQTILSALVNGYEVEQTPEDKVRDYYDQQLRANDNGTYDAPYYAIKHTLELLNIKIKGVNE